METSKKKAAQLSGSMIVRDRQKARRGFVINVPTCGPKAVRHSSASDDQKIGAVTGAPQEAADRQPSMIEPVAFQPVRQGTESLAKSPGEPVASPVEGTNWQAASREVLIRRGAAAPVPAAEARNLKPEIADAPSLPPTKHAVPSAKPSEREDGLGAGALGAGALGDGSVVQSLVQALRGGDLSQAEALFVELTALPAAAALQILYGQDAQNLAVACRALGMEQLQFVSVYIMSRKLGRAQENLDPNELAQLVAEFERTDKAKAKRIMQEWRSQLTGGRHDTPNYH